MSKGVLIQASFYEAMRYLPDGQRLELYDSICAYSLYGVEPENLSPTAMSMFILMRPNIDSSTKRYAASVANGKKGGRKAETQEEPSVNLEVIQEEPSVNPEKTREETKEEPSMNPEETKEEPSMNPEKTREETKEEPSINQSRNQNADQKPNHDYDLDYDLDLDYDSDYDSDSDSRARGAGLAASPKSPQKENDLFSQEAKQKPGEMEEEFCKKRQKAMELLLNSHYFSNARSSPIGALAV